MPGRKPDQISNLADASVFSSGVFVVAVVSSAEQRGLYANSDPPNTTKSTVCDLEWLHKKGD